MLNFLEREDALRAFFRNRLGSQPGIEVGRDYVVVGQYKLRHVEDYDFALTYGYPEHATCIEEVRGIGAALQRLAEVCFSEEILKDALSLANKILMDSESKG